ncbi:MULTISPECIES: PhzF family phenazine biosynthesis protein [unclassified Brevundimonas]|uniref:PhzF family phenazine biosynthesis protein n=1 Tax=unclassified Brevundimonas TaxID=2622653 RepID=UPI0025BAA55B|nr:MULTISPECIES: PhzF family phenazine biosynthesis protein [unclassified Brevundimonas]
MQRRYRVVDAFSATPLMGNPVAIVLDAEGLSDGQMASIARWTNLSETTFVLPATTPGADYRLRIFTPERELPFAGHPTIGTAHAVLEAGLVELSNGGVTQECGVGLVNIAVTGSGSERRLALTLPPATMVPLDEGDVIELEAILGHPVSRPPAPAVIDVGAVWAVAQVENVDALLALTPDYARSAAFERRKGLTGLSLFAVDPATGRVETRSFAPSCGVDEDPVCGSGNGCVAVFRARSGQLAGASWAYTAEQGRNVGRAGLIELSASGDVIRVGGACVTTLIGVLEV